MKRTIQLIAFDCRLERFAEVFGDDIDLDDCGVFIKEAKKVVPPAEFGEFEDCSDPDILFGAIDSTVNHSLQRRDPLRIFGDRAYMILRAFFRFLNDCYLWDDLEALDRYEEELFDSLPNLMQKNYEVLVLDEDELGRELLYIKFLDCLAPIVGEPVLSLIVEEAEEFKKSSYQTVAKCWNCGKPAEFVGKVINRKGHRLSVYYCPSCGSRTHIKERGD